MSIENADNISSLRSTVLLPSRVTALISGISVSPSIQTLCNVGLEFVESTSRSRRSRLRPIVQTRIDWPRATVLLSLIVYAQPKSIIYFRRIRGYDRTSRVIGRSSKNFFELTDRPDALTSRPTELLARAFFVCLPSIQGRE